LHSGERNGGVCGWRRDMRLESKGHMTDLRVGEGTTKGRYWKCRALLHNMRGGGSTHRSAGGRKRL